MNVWPNKIPLPAESGFTATFGTRLLRSRLSETGRVQYRMRQGTAPVTIAARWSLTAEEARNFEIFYMDDLRQGAEWFYCPWLVSLGAALDLGYGVVARFTGGLELATEGEQVNYSAELELAPASAAALTLELIP